MVLIPLYDDDLLYDQPTYSYDGYLPPVGAVYSGYETSQQSSPGSYVTSIEPREIVYRGATRSSPVPV